MFAAPGAGVKDDGRCAEGAAPSEHKETHRHEIVTLHHRW
jgi:hypothetical protein